MLTRRAFFGRMACAVAGLVAAPQIVAELAKAAAPKLSAYDLAKMARFSAMYGATGDRFYAVVTGRSVGKTTNILELQRVLAPGRRQFSAPKGFQLVEMDFTECEARILSSVVRARDTLTG